MTAPAGVGSGDTVVRRSLWHNRDFVTFWSGETLSLFGTQITVLALPLTAVITLDAQPEQLGILRFLQMVPYLLFGPLFGVWVDRHRRRTAMIGANVVRMVLIGLIPVLAGLGQLNMPVLLMITFCVGMGAVLFDISWMSFVPTLIRDPGYLVDANSKLAATSATADAAGPGVAGALVNLLSAPVAMAANAVTYLGSVISLLLIRTEEKPPPATVKRRIRTELAQGFAFVARNRLVRWIALVGGLANFFLSATQPMFILFAVREQDVPSSMLGLIFSIGAGGGIIGGMICRRLIERLHLGRVYAGALCVAFVPALLLPAASGPTLVLGVLYTVAWFLGSLGLTMVNIVIMSVRQNVTPPSLLGRMNAAVRAVMFGLGALGGPVAGLIAATAGVREALWISTGCSGVFVLCGVALSPLTRMRTMPGAATDPADQADGPDHAGPGSRPPSVPEMAD
ncbi:MFS transporter [Micromonospora rifamycinica]|uniref:Major Facilitator Superfamily protein n=1 Tax=Micromonospora rifamycinica TaxID=291594 RepID=A0A1C5GM50_9ACTN|nr:MFS transporter [Micromonospora rifamycinica]SCG34856.1 Major Facilitator Superfamily protein [Micromonospora rifamycinica]